MATRWWLTQRLGQGAPSRVAREALRRQVDGGRHGTRQRGDGRPAARLIVCGDDPLAHRVVEELVGRYRVRVTVLLASRRRGHGPDIARLANIDLIETDRFDAEAFRRARIATADALALVHQDDVGNINAALLAHELNPKLRLVIRMFNGDLAQGVRRLIPGCRVLSDAAMAAPAFASAALGEVAPQHVRLAGRTVYVARRADVRAEDVVCGLAATAGLDQPEPLPADESRADLVLATARGGTGNAGTGLPRRGAALAARLRRWRRRPLGEWALLVSRKLRVAALALVALLVTAVVILKLALGTSWLNAAYTAVLDTLAGANPNVGEPRIVKVTEIILAVVSIALIPVITAAVVEVAVNARLALALGRLREPISDHVVVVGLGNVGTRVIRRLHDLGVPMVVIDRNADARGIPVARELGVPSIIGEANRAETLRAASVQTCRALVVVSTDDAVNLETALRARSLKEDVRVVLRLFDGDFADRVQRAFGITISRSVSYLAAPAFAAAMLEREVVGTIPVGRRVLLIAEVPVCAGADLDGRPLADACRVSETRIIGLVTDARATTRWRLDPAYRLAPDDVLLVVATRAGLGTLLARTGPPVGPAPADVPA